MPILTIRALPLLLIMLLTACDSYVAPRYSFDADTNVALKALSPGAIAVGAFTGPEKFDNMCRMAGPLEVPDGLTRAAYIRKALEDELKVAGLHAPSEPRVTLTGTVNRLAFSSSDALINGSWDIDLTVRSSNGKSMAVSERYSFQSGFVAITACKQTAEAFMPAVQNLIRKVVHAPDFVALVR